MKSVVAVRYWSDQDNTNHHFACRDAGIDEGEYVRVGWYVHALEDSEVDSFGPFLHREDAVEFVRACYKNAEVL